MRSDPAPVVVCAGFDWRQPNPLRHLECALAADHRVVHVESLALRHPTLSASDLRRLRFKLGRWAGWTSDDGPADCGASGRPVEVVAPALPAVGPAPLPAISAAWVARQVRAVLRRWGDPRPWLFVTALPSALPLLPRIGARIAAYYRVDEWGQWPGIDGARVGALERALMHRVDHTFCTSTALLGSAWSRRGSPRHLPQGVDRAHFARALEPGPVLAALRGLRGPVLGFFGTLDDRFDRALLDALQRWPGSVVLAGPRMPSAPPIPASGPVRWIGPVDYGQLPALARGVDAWVLPYVVSPRTAAIDPLKLREYLATGRPVVSAALPDVRPWSPLVRVVEGGAEAFLAAAREAVRDPLAGRDERLAALAGHGWDDRCGAFLAALHEIAPPPRV